jgi:N-acyl-D-amino-acid deacylase
MNGDRERPIQELSMFDVVVANGSVIDGTGAEPVWADVAIVGDRVVAVGQIEGETAKTIDAGGQVVSPGFIDLHAHSDMSFLVDPLADSKLRQGVTLELVGNCGMSFCAPLKDSMMDGFKAWANRSDPDLQPDWSDFAGYLNALEQAGSVINVATQIGHNQVRTFVMGADARAPSSDELLQMENTVAEALDAGAMGLSTGLYFPPGYYALTDEVIALTKLVGDRDKLYSTHMRSESDESPGLFTALQESIEIGRRTGARIEVSHVKAHGPRVWGRAAAILETIEHARNEGVDVAGDQYPYVACSTPLTGAIFNRWVHDGGRPALLERLADSDLRQRLRDEAEYSAVRFQGAEGCVIAGYPPNTDYEGMTLAEVADRQGKDPIDCAFGMIEESEVFVVLYSMSDPDVETIAASPYISVCSDGNSLRTSGPLGRGKPHPRSYGSNAGFLQRMVREKNVVALPEAIRKMTLLPAQRLGLKSRGRIAPGYFADIAVFDPDTITEHATFAEPHQYSTGVSQVLVNGRLALADGELSGDTPGRVIRNHGA